MSIGWLHPILLHFPIGLVLPAAAAELVAIRTRRATWHAIAQANARAGAVGGVLAAIAGWALATAPSIEPSPMLTWHRWTGSAGALAATVAALLSLRARSVRWFQTALFAAAVLIALAGHLGGSLVWGPEILGH